MMKEVLTPPKPKKESDIMSRWCDREIVISILCISYNHERFISDTLNSILSQETKYRFEVIIHDDLSQDNTRSILKEYEKNYPEIINLILPDENQYSKGVKPFDICKKKAKGRYIAICEGDDFWCDVEKLEKQVTFLEENSEYIISCHDAIVVNGDNKVINHSKLPDRHKRDLSESELSRCKGYLLTLSWVYRNVDIPQYNEISKVVNGDTFFCSVLGTYGKAKFQKEVLPAAYREHSAGVWSKTSDIDKKVTLLNTYYWLFNYHRRIDSPYSSHFLFLIIMASVGLFFKMFDAKELFKVLTKMLFRK
ncbi:TPA: glycosyltransferase [Vibrio alginolyticus]|uniref:glycosyltransferase n=1 Tax=Vibrio harveyi group TaxID=717610 RepID=UPI0009AA6400|nr:MULTISPECIES: glycosyltransferase [Vibrio harveyi group]EHK9125924.1 glycosyltransferase [Vibrio parahaemolyticus]EHU4888626.1 glycosyltransferase [Vibrio parahaemolyticus]EHU5132665.1 glycosyltransferase [Vibrio parahaemolyticus]ELA9571866.1 glycosyltransferase [Vibrio parahaemolyticus]SUP13693.1 glycosyl transferase family protein [Vibrio alginolyticus]